ncbi:MAG: MFS transporter [Gammaproteobacteria bacterium]
MKFLNFVATNGISKNKTVYSWILYDWANSAFAVCILTVFYPLFFKSYWHPGVDATTSTFHLGLSNSVASIIIVFIAPVIGSIADSSSSKKYFLIFFALMGVLFTAGLYFIHQGEWLIAALFYVMASVGFMGANIFYDSLLLIVSDTNELDIISSLGYAFGYIGGGILFVLNILLVTFPEWFGIMDKTLAVRVSFVSVAVWWLLFSVPLMLYVSEPKKNNAGTAFHIIKSGLSQLKNTFYEIKKFKIIVIFLAAYWLYIDGVDTIVRMSVDYGLSIGLDTNNLIIAIMITQFVGFPAAIAFGFIGKKLGPKNGILIAICVYIFVTIYSVSMTTSQEFYIMAITIGLVQGGIQSLSRSLFASIIPADKSAEFFGFYNMMGKFAAVLGPLMVGGVAVLTSNSRYAMLSLIALFIAGGIILYFVDEKKAIKNLEKM